MLIVIALAIVEERRVPWDEEAYSDSDSDDDNDINLQGSTELQQLHASMKSAITSLMRLSMAIQEPAPNRQARCSINLTSNSTMYFTSKLNFPLCHSTLRKDWEEPYRAEDSISRTESNTMINFPKVLTSLVLRQP